MCFLPLIARFLYWMKSRWQGSGSFVNNSSLLRGRCTILLWLGRLQGSSLDELLYSKYK